MKGYFAKTNFPIDPLDSERTASNMRKLAFEGMHVTGNIQECDPDETDMI